MAKCAHFTTWRRDGRFSWDRAAPSLDCRSPPSSGWLPLAPPPQAPGPSGHRACVSTHLGFSPLLLPHSPPPPACHPTKGLCSWCRGVVCTSQSHWLAFSERHWAHRPPAPATRQQPSEPHIPHSHEDLPPCQDSCEQPTSSLFKILLGDFKEEIRNIVQR